MNTPYRTRIVIMGAAGRDCGALPARQQALDRFLARHAAR